MKTKRNYVLALLTALLGVLALVGLFTIDAWLFGYNSLEIEIVEKIGSVDQMEELYDIEKKYHCETPGYHVVRGDYQIMYPRSQAILDEYKYIYIINDRGTNRVFGFKEPIDLKPGEKFKLKVKGGSVGFDL